MTEALLRAEDLHISFGGVKAADGLRLDIHRGEVLAIIGPNGAGKTTFINICTGYLRPQQGRVLFEGRDVTSLQPRQITRLGIARTFQIPQLFREHTVLENLMLAAAVPEGLFWKPWASARDPRLEARARETLDQLGLQPFADRPARILPEGIAKLVDVGMALVQQPKLLLMDEPTTSVSSEEKFRIMEVLLSALRRREVTAVFIEHDVDVVTTFADRAALASEGKFQVIGDPAEVMEQAMRVH